MSIGLAFDSHIVDLNGRSLVFIGALGSHREMWKQQTEAFTAMQSNWVSIDPRGLGDSPAPVGPYTVSQLAADVIETLDDLGIHTADVIGISLGGAIAQQLAIDFPDRVSSLTLISTTMRFGTKEAWQARAIEVRRDGTGNLGNGIDGRWLTAEFGKKHPDVLKRAQDWITNTNKEGYASCAEALGDWDATERIMNIQVPTLVMGGINDKGTNPELVTNLAHALKNSTLVLLEPAAHLANLEQAGMVTALIAEHVGAISKTKNAV